MTDSLRLGVGWRESEGPTAGYFPFYIGLFLAVASVVNLVRAWFDRAPGDSNVCHPHRDPTSARGAAALRRLCART